MTIKNHNLPRQPYKVFFGRKDTLLRIKNILIEGGTFIASIDGVGGIGKSAFAYYFCKEHLMYSERFDYIIWISAKNTLYNPFSKIPLEVIENKFEGLKTLFNTTFRVTGFEELESEPFEIKKSFFEDIIQSEKIFFVFDNLETIEDDSFFKYLTEDFNRFSANNKNLKILTTSRKRKKIADFPIEIDGLEKEDALSMLISLAKEYQVKLIQNATLHDNFSIIQRCGAIPLVIEHIVARSANKRTLGEIYRELEEYPNPENFLYGEEKNRALADIVMFSFKGMYETLSSDCQTIFKYIASLEKNKWKKDDKITSQLLVLYTSIKREIAEESLEVLLENKLINYIDGEYTISPMAINFAQNYYDDFEDIEEEVLRKKQNFKYNTENEDKIDLFIKNVMHLEERNLYTEAENMIIDYTSNKDDFRLFLKLAEIQEKLGKFIPAENSYRKSIENNPTFTKSWYDWILMQKKRKRHSKAYNTALGALEATNNEITIVLITLDIILELEGRKDMDIKEVRDYIGKHIKNYKDKKQNIDCKILIKKWNEIENDRLEKGKDHQYFISFDNLIDIEDDKMLKRTLACDLRKILKKYKESTSEIDAKINLIDRTIRKDIPTLKKDLLDKSDKDYESAKKISYRILQWADKNEDQIFALKILLTIMDKEKDYKRIIEVFLVYQELSFTDSYCKDLYIKAEKIEKQKKLDEIHSKIKTTINKIEIELRKIILWSHNSDEKEFRLFIDNMIKRKNIEENWLEEWEKNRNRSLDKEKTLIEYSTLGQIKTIISWSKPVIISRITKNQEKLTISKDLKILVSHLENINSIRNLAFHSNLPSKEEDLLEYQVDTNRVYEQIVKLRENLYLSTF